MIFILHVRMFELNKCKTKLANGLGGVRENFLTSSVFFEIFEELS